MHSEAPSRYRQCRDCDFWVTVGDRHCPNCGIVAPYRPRGERRRARPAAQLQPLRSNPRATALLIGSITGGLAAWSVTAALADRLGWGVAGGAIPVELLPAMLGVPTGAVAGWWVQHNIEFPRDARVPRAREYLCLFERTVQERLADLAHRGARLRRSVERVSDEPAAEPWTSLRAALECAEVNLLRQGAEFRAKLWEIAAVRVENALEASSAEQEHLSSDDCRRRLDSLYAARDRAESVVAEWDSSTQAAGVECVSRLRTLLPLCEEARQALVAQEAVEALRAAAPAADPQLYALPRLPDRSCRLAARSELNQLARSFDALEHQYARVAAEQELLGQPTAPSIRSGEPRQDG
jgi:hypothetical protein